MKNNDTYSTRDLYESAFLYASHLKLLKLEKSGSFYWFIFQNRDKGELLSSKYWAREGNISPKLYGEAIRSLKDMIFSRQDRY